MTRRDLLHTLGAAGIAGISSAWLSSGMEKRPIPSSGERIAPVGVGTWQTFDVGANETERAPLREVLKTMVAKGAAVIDSSPMYGESEKVVGDLSVEAGVNDKLFIATKVWTSGREEGIRQMTESMRLLQRSKVDLMQVHNLVDWKIHLETMQRWRDDGKIRYIGITHYLDSVHSAMEDIIRKNRIDFIQVNYSVTGRHAADRLLPAAADLGVAVLINRPFQEGALFRAVRGKALPAWAAEFGCISWAQVFLKFILANRAVTCVIPGTSKTEHLLDNLGAATGRLPDKDEREKIIRLFS